MEENFSNGLAVNKSLPLGFSACFTAPNVNEFSELSFVICGGFKLPKVKGLVAADAVVTIVADDDGVLVSFSRPMFETMPESDARGFFSAG